MNERTRVEYQPTKCWSWLAGLQLDTRVVVECVAISKTRILELSEVTVAPFEH